MISKKNIALQIAASGIVNPILDDSVQEMSGIEFFNGAIQTIIGVLLTVAAILFFLYFLLGGITWITSGGDKGKIEAARSRVMQAVIGIIVVFAIFAIAKLIEALFAISILELPIGELSIGSGGPSYPPPGDGTAPAEPI